MPSKEKESSSGMKILIQIKEGNVKKDEREYALTPLLGRILNVDFLATPANADIKAYNKERAKVRDMKEFFSKYA